jgi:Protein of unknown function (DUF551)
MWRTIETAPTTGVPVLLAIPAEMAVGRWLVAEAYFREDEDEYVAGWWWANTGPNEHGVSSLKENGYRPTHWMPLPAPPTDQPLT